MRRSINKRKALQCLYIFGIILCCVLSIVFGNVAIGTARNKEVSENGSVVTATYVEVERYILGKISDYFLRYYYKDIDGIEYTGTTTYHYSTKEEAEKHIGEEVLIKIDGNGKSVFADYNPPSPILFWVLCVLCVLSLPTLLVISILNGKKLRILKQEYKEKYGL